jgi:hypothetical protein
VVTVLGRRPLQYRRGADAALDRPGHVRASSALVWLGERLIVVQDDAAFLGILDPATALVDDVPFLTQVPRTFDAARGNKADKPDLEAAYVDGDLLVALGSGGPLPARRAAVTWRPGEEPRVIALPRLFEAISAAVLPAGTSLNLEGAVLDGDTVILANRGGDGGRSPDALIRIEVAAMRALLDDPEGAPLPAFQIERVGLGELEGCPLHFSDLAPHADGLLYVAVAEATTSFFDDGAVRGSVLGILGGRRLGTILADKIEGIAAAGGDRLWLVTDPDDPTRPGELLDVQLG